jgi:hypothetical protein
MSIEINELKINLITNIPDKQNIEYTKDLLYHPDIEINASINKYPYLVSNIELTKDYFDGYEYDKLVNVFFNRNTLLGTVKKMFGGNNSNAYKEEISSDPREIMLIEKKNVYLIMKLLFPTKMNSVKNYHASYDYVVPGKTTLDVGFYYNPLKTNFSYIKKKDVYTVIKVTWLNDIMNHPSYKKLINNTMTFLKARKQRIIRLEQDGASQLEKDKANAYKTTLFTANRDEIKDDSLLKDFITIELAKYIDQGELGNVKSGAIFFPGNIEWQTLLLTKNKDEVNKFYVLIENAYEKYINEDLSIDMTDYNKYIQTGVDNINIGKSNMPQKQVYLIIDFIQGEVNDNNKKEVYCPYTDQYLGSILEHLLFPEKDNSWEVTPASYIYSVKDKDEIQYTNSKKQNDIQVNDLQDMNETETKYNDWDTFQKYIFLFDNDPNKDKYSQILANNNINALVNENKINNRPLLLLLKQLSNFIKEPTNPDANKLLDDLLRLKSQNEVEIKLLQDKIKSGRYPSDEIKEFDTRSVQFIFFNSLINNALNFSSFKKDGGTRRKKRNKKQKTKKVRFNI